MCIAAARLDAPTAAATCCSTPAGAGCAAGLGCYVASTERTDCKAPGTAGDKKGVLVNLYGGIGLIDEVKVMAAGK